MRKMPPHSVLIKLFYYDEEIGMLRYKKNINSWCKKDAIAGETKLNKNRHQIVEINGWGSYMVSRLIFCYFHKKIPKGYVIDHISGDPSDNRIENLRCCSVRENMLNQKCHRKGASYGVCKSGNYYYPRIRVGSKRIKLGRFETEEEAKRAYDNALYEQEFS